MGNRSQAVTVDNPNYQSAANEPVATTKPVQTAPIVTTKPVTDTTPTKPATNNGTPTPVEPTAPQEPDQEAPSSDTALTPDGNISLSDDISGATSDEKQFSTVTPAVCSCTDKYKAGAVNATGGLLVIVLVLALAGGGAAYFLKFKKNEPDTRGTVDLDDYDLRR